METSTLAAVQDYYGEVLHSKADLRTSACCSTETLPPHIRAIVSEIEDEVLDRFYGCGSPIPDALEGCTVLDLGCGTGRDVFIASRLVGPDGFVIGVDMTEAQLDVARRNLDTQMERFGYAHPNVAFRRGYIEDLKGLGIATDSVDVVISNCVLNLSPEKEVVFSEIFRVLKPGGELYFSDIFADRRLPAHIAADPVLRGECLGGALYIEDFRRMLRRLGCLDYRTVSQSTVTIDDPDLERKIGFANFTSRTIRAFHLPDDLEDICEDFGQVAVYRGTIPETPHRFILDDHHVFETGRPERVCGNTAAMLQETRFGRHFDIIGDRSVHFGAFDCAPPVASGEPTVGSCC